ncbi:hypothetical protein RI367_003750 [Sorochytrium milnesiophthora]
MADVARPEQQEQQQQQQQMPAWLQNQELLSELSHYKSSNQQLQAAVNALRDAATSAPTASATATTPASGDISPFISSLEQRLSTANEENTTLRENVKQLQKKYQHASAQAKQSIEATKEVTNQYNHLRAKFQAAVLKNRELVQALKDKDAVIQLLRDEAQTRELELNTTEDKLAKLQKENRQLVERWVKKMEEEAEKMNEANHFIQSVAVMKEKASDRALTAAPDASATSPAASTLNQTPSPTSPPEPTSVTEPTTPGGLNFIRSRFSTLLGSAGGASAGSLDIQPASLPKGLVKKVAGAFFVIACLGQHCLIANYARPIQVHESEAVCMTLSPDGRFVATGGNDDKLNIWHSNGSLSTLTCIAIDSSTTSLASGTASSIVRLYSLSNNLKLTHTLTGHIAKVTTLAYSGRADRLISGGQDRTLKLWDLEKSYCVRTMFAHSNVLDMMMMDWAGNNVASAHLDAKIRLWDCVSGNMVKEISGVFQSSVTSLRPLGHDVVIACSRDNNLKTVDLRTGEEQATFQGDGFRVGSNTSSIGVSPDKLYVVAGSADGAVYLWDIRQQKLLQSLRNGHRSNVCAVAWDVKGSSKVYSLEKDKTMCLWE